MMESPTKNVRDYPNYKRTFQRLKPLFSQLADEEKVPRSFVLRYCEPQPVCSFKGHPLQKLKWGFV